jgi:nucleotide-binding universal stress UspA family protein
MSSYRNIVVARDFSSCAESAFRTAVSLARHSGATLHVVFAEILHSDLYRDQATHESLENEMGARLRESTGDLAGVEMKHAVVRDVAAAPAILTYAEEVDADLIVVGTHGRRGIRRLFLGSVAEELVRAAPCPVLAVRTEASADPEDLKTILVPTDFSVHALGALKQARELAATFGARIDLLHIVESNPHPAFYDHGVFSVYDVDPNFDEKVLTHLKEFFRKSEGPEVEVEYHVMAGVARRDIAQFAATNASGMIVMATHGLTGLKHFLIGSVAEKTVRQTPCPIYVVKAFEVPRVPRPQQSGIAAQVLP